ncbi:MAG: ParA family partition ATPase [Kiloniellaceae bacterium]
MAATIITVAQQKGGAGKTTLAANLAIAYAQGKRKVAVADIDPQRSLTMWHALRQELHGEDSGITVVDVGGWKLAAELDRLRRDHDIVVIDSPPHAETDAKIAVRQGQLVVIPVQPSPMDVWATEPILAVAQKESTPVLLVLNRVPPRANLTEEMMFEIKDLLSESERARIAESRIGNRVAFAGAMLKGLGVTEFQPKGQAAQEIRALSKEILKVAG